MRLDGHKVTVVGLGRSGEAAARLLLRQGARVTCSEVSLPRNWPGPRKDWPRPDAPCG